MQIKSSPLGETSHTDSVHRQHSGRRRPPKWFFLLSHPEIVVGSTKLLLAPHVLRRGLPLFSCISRPGAGCRLFWALYWLQALGPASPCARPFSPLIRTTCYFWKCIYVHLGIGLFFRCMQVKLIEDEHVERMQFQKVMQYPDMKGPDRKQTGSQEPEPQDRNQKLETGRQHPKAGSRTKNKQRGPKQN